MKKSFNTENQILTRTVLGLDIGKASIGWALIELKEKKEISYDKNGEVVKENKGTPIDYKILGKGVRVWAEPVDDKGKSLALEKGSARRARRTIQRRANRMNKLLKIFKDIGLINKEINIKDIKARNHLFPASDIWELRKNALDSKLSNEEFTRVLYYIIKHRGFYFTAKTDLKDSGNKEDKKVKGGLDTTKALLQPSNKYRTIGEAFYNKYPKGERRNGKDDYSKSIPRELLEQELKEVFKYQREFINQYATEDLEKKVIELLYLQKEVEKDSILSMLRKCELEPKEYVAPAKSYSNELSNLWQKLNNLDLRNIKKKNENRSLTKEEKAQVVKKSFSSAKVTYTQLRKELSLSSDYQFNLIKYYQPNPENLKPLSLKKEDIKEDTYIITIKNVVTDEEKEIDLFHYEGFKKCIEDCKQKNYKTFRIPYYKLRQWIKLDGKTPLSEDYQFAKLTYCHTEKEIIKKEGEEKGHKNFLEQFEKETFFEAKGYNALKKALEKDYPDYWQTIKDNQNDSLDKIAEILFLYKEDSHRKEELSKIILPEQKEQNRIINSLLELSLKGTAGHSLKAIKKILPYLQEGKMYSEARKSADYPEYKETKYGGDNDSLKPIYGTFTKNPVIHRVFSQVRKLVNAINKQYKQQNNSFCIDQINIETAKELKNSKKQLDKIKSEQKENKLENELAKESAIEWKLKGNESKVKFYKQQNCQCPYCNKPLKPEDLKENVEIDHILPFSQSFNNSQNNKVVVHKRCNQEKKKRTPYQWLGENNPEEWREFEERIQSMKNLSYSKRKNLLNKTFHKDVKNKKDEFLSRDLVNARYASKLITNYLEENFNFKDSQRNDIKNKVQVRSGRITSLLRNSWNIDKNREENDLHHAKDALVLAFSTQGMVHFISNSVEKIEEQGGNVSTWMRKGLSPIKFLDNNGNPVDTNELTKRLTDFKENLNNEVSNEVSGIFVSRMPRRKVTKNYHEDGVLQDPEKKTRRKREKTADPKHSFPVRGGKAAQGTMVRGDFFKDNKGKIHMIPIYPYHLTWSKVKNPLPTIIEKVKESKKDKRKEITTLSVDNMNFMFSLYKDELIKLGKKKDGSDAEFYYVKHFRSDGSKIAVTNIDGSPFYKEGKEPEKDKEFGYSTGFLQKYTVGMLGNKIPVKSEKRVDNITKKPKAKNNSNKT